MTQSSNKTDKKPKVLPESIEIKFDLPILIAKVEHKSLSMRRPKVRDMKAGVPFEAEEEKELAIIACLMDLQTNDIDAQWFSDYRKMQKGYHSFFSLSWEDCRRGMSLIGAYLHFPPSDQLGFDMEDFIAYLNDAQEIREAQSF